jgi:DeoR/GlpR family transcriptional regulator of sugar metabolism
MPDALDACVRADAEGLVGLAGRFWGRVVSLHHEVAVTCQLFEVSTRSDLVADSSTFGRIAVGKICNLEDFDALIVDSQLPDSVRKWAAATSTPII